MNYAQGSRHRIGRRTVALVTVAVLGGGAITAARLRADDDDRGQIRHVLLLSIDGMHAVDFDNYVLPNEFAYVYAPGTEQNRPGHPGRYVFWLVRGLAVEDGSYELQVEASDTRGNTGSSSYSFEIQSLRTINRASP